MTHTTIVLFGGPSDERHVSVASAQAIVRVLPNAFAWYWAPEGAVYDVNPKDLLSHQRPFELDFLPARPAIFPNLEQALDTMPVDNPVLLLALHGTGGEDGPLQEMLEKRGIPFTGSGSVASAAAFDKEQAKEMVKGHVRLAESRVARTAAEVRPMIEEMLSRHERLVLKPLAAGSSRGLFFLGRNDDAEDVAEKVVARGIPYIIEQFVQGRELTCGVIDSGDGPAALPVIEIEVDPNRTFDYEGKYLGAGTREICPADIPEAMAAEAQETSVAAHIALGCEGYSRSDLIAAEDGIYYLETNTLPGLTASSLVPQELKVVGIEFREFLERQVELALERAQRVPASPKVASNQQPGTSNILTGSA
ncbi:MAG TPA: ATP-grasp domain-containing protein [Thermoanaerobaculia bacterium]|nr:ATP-grasp domain-containing protein [Thermoanaerobaculia bacterium]